MRYTILILVSIFLVSCSTDTPISSTEVKVNPIEKKAKSVTAKDSYTQDSSLFGEWMFEKIPDNKGASVEDQKKMLQVFGDTKLQLSEKEYNIFMMGTLDTGTWTNLDQNTLELKSASGRTQKIGVKKINNSQSIFTFLGDKDLQMKKPE